MIIPLKQCWEYHNKSMVILKRYWTLHVESLQKYCHRIHWFLPMLFPRALPKLHFLLVYRKQGDCFLRKLGCSHQLQFLYISHEELTEVDKYPQVLFTFHYRKFFVFWLGFKLKLKHKPRNSNLQYFLVGYRMAWSHSPPWLHWGTTLWFFSKVFFVHSHWNSK